VIGRAIAVALGLAAVAPAPALAAPKRVLVVTQATGFVHDSIPAALRLARELGRRSPDYDVAPLAGARQLTAARLRGADAVAFLNTTGDLPVHRAALQAFVRRGGGLLGTHSATDTLHGWPGWAGMLGGEFRMHPPLGPGRLIVEDRSHPATRTLPRRFEVVDEFYAFVRDPRCCSHVLVRQDTGRGGPDRPIVWSRRYGRGRVFYDGLGHTRAIWRDPRQRALVSGGLRWVLRL
jgi:type 1 glutamine amidotransferase